MAERGNTWTHLIGVLFALSCIWMAWPAVQEGWQMALGVILFIVGMFLMFLSSTIYHWLPQGRAKGVLRRCDHISIYLMIACSYSPLLIGVVGGWIGWSLFAFQWVLVVAGAVFKIRARPLSTPFSCRIFDYGLECAAGCTAGDEAHQYCRGTAVAGRGTVLYHWHLVLRT